MNIALLLAQPFELDLNTKISEEMINKALAMKDLPSPVKKVTVELLVGLIKINIQTAIPLMKNISVDARIIGIKLSRKKSTVQVELLGTAGAIIKRLLGFLKAKVPNITTNDSILDIDITKNLLKVFPGDAASILDKARVHVTNQKRGFLNLTINKV